LSQTSAPGLRPLGAFFVPSRRHGPGRARTGPHVQGRPRRACRPNAKPPPRWSRASPATTSCRPGIATARGGASTWSCRSQHPQPPRNPLRARPRVPLGRSFVAAAAVPSSGHLRVRAGLEGRPVAAAECRLAGDRLLGPTQGGEGVVRAALRASPRRPAMLQSPTERSCTMTAAELVPWASPAITIALTGGYTPEAGS